MNTIHALELLKEVLTILDNHGIFSWVVSGSLLGLIREKRIIEHDQDIDIAVEIKSFQSYDIPSILKRNGYTHHQSIRIVNSGIYACEHSFKKSGIKVDVFGYECDDKKYWTYAYIPKPGNSWLQQLQPIKYVWDLHSFEKRDILNDGFMFNIPAEPEKWLEEAYGKNWRIPTIKWDYETDSPNKYIDTKLVGKLTYF